MKKLIATLMILETRQGLRKNEWASMTPMGDGLGKIKVDPFVSPVAQVSLLSHEWMHFLFGIFKAKGSGRRLTITEEEALCNKVGNYIKKLFKKEFKKKERK